MSLNIWRLLNVRITHHNNAAENFVNWSKQDQHTWISRCQLTLQQSEGGVARDRSARSALWHTPNDIIQQESWWIISRTHKYQVPNFAIILYYIIDDTDIQEFRQVDLQHSEGGVLRDRSARSALWHTSNDIIQQESRWIIDGS